MFKVKIKRLDYHVVNFPSVPIVQDYMGQSMQEWTRQNIWKTALKNLRGYCLLFRAFLLPENGIKDLIIN